MRSAGICVGASSVQCVILVLSENGSGVQESFRRSHDGSPEGVLQDILLYLRAEGVEYCSVTGRRFRNRLAVETISEPEAVERALKEEYPPEKGVPDYVVSLGGEARVVYQINRDGEIESAETGSKCASGTGEFFLQQVRRMGLEPKQAVELSFEGDPAKISGRCSVFCKSDCTHALNKGAPVENVLAGLGFMMADMIGELTGETKDKWILLIGGGTYNTFLIKVLRERCRKVEAGELSPFFEAYGAALNAADKRMVFDYQDFKEFNVNHFEQGFHPRLSNAENKVEYHTSERIVPESGEAFVLGLDVGSTTTKALLLREGDRGVGPSVYLRTKGDPVQASRECYRELKKKLRGADIRISGLGVTGSGRQIAGLHALTEDIVNEIVAHASAALYFNKDVDTIFEIGGQDAKYTYFTNGTPSDYAMNEACSAGTGSFLEEAAYESLNIDVYEIAERALKADNPPNFTDQCSAFISSDIKNAIQEGIGTDDILAGIVYSICLNYINRVKGNRPVGKNVFMQGGVCYNSAVPLAMANLLGADITVPPDPGLMGAFGVANKVLERIEQNSKRESYDLDDLIERSADKVGEFTCSGGKEKCDRGCRVSRIRIRERVYPFGGMCDKYYNLRLKKEFDTDKLDLVKYRQNLMFDKYGPEEPAGADERLKRVGLNKSLITYSLYPLFSEFFSLLGFKIVLPDDLSSKGIAMSKSSFCMPVESAHGSFHNLLEKGCDYLFLPQVMQIPVENVPTYSRLCPFVQGEPYYLKTTFKREIEDSGAEVISPVLKMWGKYSNAENAFVDTAESMGVSRKEAEAAFKKAVIKQEGFERELLEKGQDVLKEIESDPERIGIVLLGRPYNAFAEENNMGVSHKVASRGYTVIPFDMVPSGNYSVHKNMFWAMGQK
ncbi:MAG: acyl-CoA dehydratase activase, partial [Chitinivibrionales bacterium]